MKVYFEQVHDAIRGHALQAAPNQMCGLIVQCDDGLKYLKCTNVAEDTYNYHCFSQKDLNVAETQGKIVARVHSHDRMPHASKADMEEQISSGLPCGIAFVRRNAVQNLCFFGDRLPIQDYTGRPFIHGVYDCYALVRDYHQGTLGIQINQYPRDNKWWRSDQNLLFDNIRDAGFVIVDKKLDAIEKNDCILARINAPFVNHCGVYTGEGMLLHHICMRSSSLSQAEPLDDFDCSKITHIVRHKSA